MYHFRRPSMFKGYSAKIKLNKIYNKETKKLNTLKVRNNFYILNNIIRN